jgi:hypothetical protein
MKIVTNEKLINRNAKIAKFTFYISLAIFGGGLIASFQKPDDPALLTWTMAALILGFTFSQVSIYFQNRFGKKPRPDEHLSDSLKGLDSKFTLYHYRSPLSHLLVGPSGIWGFLPYSQNGTIRFDKDRWKQKGGSVLMRLFGGESLGRPDLEASATEKEIAKMLFRVFPEQTVLPPIRIALVFTNPTVKIEAEDAPIPTLTAKKLKETVRKYIKTEAIPDETLAQINQYLEEKYPTK